MNDRIAALKALQDARTHHAVRQPLPAGIENRYRQHQLPDFTRTALRLQTALSLETPYLFPDELIAFTRTRPALPCIDSDAEMEALRKHHYLHELGNVSNLSPDYGTVIARGLLALREKLTDSPYHQAMRISIDAVLDLTGRYAAAARSAGNEALAAILDRVPAYPARTFREALQSLRILHYVLWCEGLS